MQPLFLKHSSQPSSAPVKVGFLVYSTSVENQFQISRLLLPLNELVGEGNWNFDLADVDHILRIKAVVSGERVIELLQNHGFLCIELD